MNNYYALILAGGGGTRLWPMSRQSRPKQMLPLVDQASLFRISVMRLAPLFPPENVFIATGEMYVEDMRNDVPEIPEENYFVEPYGKNNAPAVALGLAHIYKKDPEAIVAILTADHHIAREGRFREVLEVAYNCANDGKIVTLGIHPSYPATGFGYIHQADHIHTTRDLDIFHSNGFVEKPNEERAIQFLQSGEYTWNSGMFIWSVEKALGEFKRQRPEMYALIEKLIESADTDDYNAVLREVWDSEDMLATSIDYAIMENAEDMVVIPIEIGWNDVGSWSSLFDVLECDVDGNCSRGKVSENKITMETTNTFMMSDKLVVTIGVKDLVIVDTDDALLICHKDQTQDVKKVVQHLKDNGSHDYL